MRRRIDLALLSTMMLLWACAPSPAFGQNAAGRSTIRIVHAPEPTVEAAPRPESSDVWAEEVERAPIAPPRQPAEFQPAPEATAMPRPAFRPAFPSQRVTNAARAYQVRPAIAYSGGTGGAYQVSHANPVGMPPLPQSQPAGRRTKPFSNLVLDPAISPFLNLDREEDAVELPNYHAFVRPQLEQQEAYRQQQMEIQRLERQWNNQPPGAMQAYPGPSARSARFMDTAQYYGRWQR